MATELRTALLLKLAKDIGPEKAIAIIREHMGKVMVQYYDIKNIKQLDRKEKVQILMPQAHRDILLEYLTGKKQA
jgi:hypothetical protein